MSDTLQPIRGTKDLLPKDFNIHDHIINTARRVGTLYGYEAMSTPIIEYTNVFTRTLGETSDVISKEIYSFPDRKGKSIALRPEFTASVMRAYVSNSLSHNLPLKYFSYGPLFRYDRPQLGRQRQLHQVNFEYIGAEGPQTDAETIRLAQHILEELEIINSITLELNSLGCNESRAMYQKKLKEYFYERRLQLSEDSLRRLDTNPLRILDSKDEKDQEIVKGAPLIYECYTDVSKRYFDDVTKFLDKIGVCYTINPRLVRGLDYYCHTAFEFTTTILGAQSSIIGGGRYDGLAELMGALRTPAVGFGAGIERIALMRDYNIVKDIRAIHIIAIGKENIATSFDVANHLRLNNISVIVDTEGKVDKRIARAVDKLARFVIFIGDQERIENRFKIKDLDLRTEVVMNVEEIIALLHNDLKYS